MKTPSHLFLKICTCSLAILAVCNIIQFPVNLLPEQVLAKMGQFFAVIMQAEVVIAIIGGLSYAIIWHQREKENRIDSGWHHAFTQAIIRYWLAYSISVYGFAKILKTQLQSPPYQIDVPLGDLSGFELTWYYFGYSYILAAILGFIQVGGSVLLLFRRTTLLGVMILLPVMVNIVLINAFYQIASGAFFNSVVFTLGLVLFLFIDFEKLKTVFWDLLERFPPIGYQSHVFRHLIRVLTIGCAYMTIYYFVWKYPSDQSLIGAWRVDSHLKNGQKIEANTWLTDTSSWQKVYFTEWRGLYFSPNPYRYKQSESFGGRYSADTSKGTLRFGFPNQSRAGMPMDTLMIELKNRTARSMDLHYVLRRDTIDLHLTKIR